MNIRRYIGVHSAYVMVAAIALTLGCQSKPQNQQPSAEEQKKIEQQYQKSLEQERQLTSGYAANTGYAVNGGYQQATISPAPRYSLYGSLSPESQQLVATAESSISTSPKIY